MIEALLFQQRLLFIAIETAASALRYKAQAQMESARAKAEMENSAEIARRETAHFESRKS